MSRGSEETLSRKIIIHSWNNPYATGSVNGKKRVIGEFKAVTNIGDFLSRVDYRCGSIPTPIQPNSVSWRSRIGSIIMSCDDSGIPPSNTNTKFVPDSSEYTKYKKIRSFNQNFYDSKTTNHHFVR